MNKKVLFPGLCLFGTLFLLSFVDSPRYQEPWKAPQSADTLKNPLTQTPQVIREGEKLYQTYCTSCHGKTGLGDGSPGKFPIEPANFHSKKVIDQTDGALFWKLSSGRGVMPAYRTAFTETQRWQLVTYLRQLPKQYSAVSASKAKPDLNLSSLAIKTPISSIYAPIPKKITNALKTEFNIIMVDTIAKGLSRPWSMTFLPNGSIIIPERAGKIQLIKNGSVQKTPVSGDIPHGLRDIKLHPDFKNNNLIYLTYYIDPVKPDGGYSVLTQAKLIGNELTEQKTIYKAGPFPGDGEWYGSKIVFDNKGFIYFTSGIRGPRINAQNLANSEGKIMRLNADGSIPADNPFVNTVGVLPEIYSYGHRMHEGLAFDALNNRVLSTEFGELGGDELNVILPGANYGWPIATYSLEYNGSTITQTPLKEGVNAPLHHFATAPSDLEIINSRLFPEWKGNIIIGGLAAKNLYRLNFVNDKLVNEETMLDNIGRVRDIKVGPDGLIYVLTEDNGLLIRLIPLQRK